MVLLMLGGAIGTLCRYWLARWIGLQPWARGFPYGTMIVNVSGCFILGMVGGLLLEPMLAPENEHWYLLLGSGFCGGYTTFSTFAWETSKQIRDGSWWPAFANAAGSVVAGILGVFLALILIHGVFGRR